MLPEGDKGDARRGAVVFREQCSGCHKMYGEGEAIGPDLTGVDRSLDFLLASVIDPSAAIRKEYMPVTVAMADGRVLTGLVVEESEKALTLFDSRKERTVVAREEIEEMRGAEVSVMPEGLVDELSEIQVRDLFKFMQGAGPPG
jgi:putative heme-binding domain-containing protein